MPSIVEIANAIAGSLMLARRNLDGYRYFDTSLGGFWRSFLAIFLIIPLALSIAGPERSVIAELDKSAAANLDPMLLARSVILAVNWAVFPIVMMAVCRMLKLGHRYVPLIVVYNWSSLPAVALLTPPFLLYQAGLLGAESAFIFYLVISGAIIWFRWFVARTALQTTPAIAAGIVSLELLLDIVVGSSLIRLF